MKVEKQNVPLLRFPEFSGEWEEKRLGEIINHKKGYAFKSECYVDNGVRIIRVSDLSARSIKNDINHTNIYLDQSRKNEFKEWKLNSEDLIITTVGSRPPLYDSMVGKAILFPKKIEECYLNQNAVILRSRDGVNQRFIYNNITQSRYVKHIENVVRGNANQVSITLEDLFSYTINLPTLSEQSKTSDFLSVIDERLELLVEKKKMLESYKKGVMQKLFSQEIRFKDENGNEYLEWGNELFGNIYTFHPTNSYSRDCLNMTSGYVKNIHYGDIHVKYKSILNVHDEDIPFINSDIDLAKVYNDNYCQDKDLVIADASEDYADIGKTVEVKNINNQQVVAGLHTILARPNKKEVASCFGGYLMQSENIKSQIKIIAQGTKVLGLSSKRLAKVALKLPSIEEQTKIAKFITALDDKITTMTNKITYTQQYKKALLQQMFA